MIDAATQERLYANVVEQENYAYATPCWVWTGRLNDDGYAVVDIDRKPKRAVRVMYELIIGPIPRWADP